MMKKGGCDGIGGKKFLPLPPDEAEVFTLLYFTYSLLSLLSLLDPRRKKERNKLD